MQTKIKNYKEITSNIFTSFKDVDRQKEMYKEVQIMINKLNNNLNN